MVGGQFSNLAASSPEASAGVGAFVFFGQPPAGKAASIRSGLAALTADAAVRGQVVPWMSTDEEGGYVQRLANVIGPLPSPREMAALWSTAKVESVMEAHGVAMLSLGIDMDLGPVLDTASPANTIADESDRSFSANGQAAAAYGIAFANGLRSAGVVPVDKHFPGIGDANANTDLGPATDPSLSQLEKSDLIPFIASINAGVPVIMVSNVDVPGLTGTQPASLSTAAYQFLRNSLQFGGVVMTDSLGGGAISSAGYSQPAAAVAAIEAGADMVLIAAGTWGEAIAALQKAVTNGELRLAEVNDAVARVLKAKGLHVCATSPRSAASSLGAMTDTAAGSPVSLTHKRPF